MNREERFIKEIEDKRKNKDINDSVLTDKEKEIKKENINNIPEFKRITPMDEIHEIMYSLRGLNSLKDGDYRSTHLASILEYLKNKKRENKSLTLQKLALIIGMSQRQIRENYVDGMLAFGIIQLSTDCSEWFWIGAKALKEEF